MPPADENESENDCQMADHRQCAFHEEGRVRFRKVFDGCALLGHLLSAILNLLDGSRPFADCAGGSCGPADRGSPGWGEAESPIG